MGIAELGIAQMPFAEKSGVIAHIRQHFGDCYFLGIETGIFHRERHRMHARADRIPPGLKGGAGRRTGRFRIHAHKVYALLGHLVHLGGFKPAHSLNFGNTDFAKRGVIPHDVDDIGLGAVLCL